MENYFNNYDEIVMLLNNIDEYIDTIIYLINTKKNKIDVNEIKCYISTIYQVIDYINVILGVQNEEETN